MSNGIGNATQCTSCTMYAFLEVPIEGEYCCAGCERVASLEAQIRALESQVATLRSINNLERSLDITQQVLAGASLEEVGEMEEQDLEVGSWVTERRRGRGKSAREASPELVQPSKYAKLDDAGDIDSGMAMQEQATSPSCQGSAGSRQREGGDSGKDRQVLVVGDSIIRRTERAICQKDRVCRTVCCLPGARVRHIADRIDRLLGGAGNDPAVVVHVGTNDKVRGSWRVLKNDFRELGSKLKRRTSKVVFSEILPVPRATPDRQQELREVNKWLRHWCRKEGFGFLENWADFSVGYQLFSKDGLHLNGGGAALLGRKIAAKLEEVLN